MKLYYPIGTVVSLVGGDRPLMIFGRQILQATTNTHWDYVACLYPEGYLGDDYNIFFQHEEVARVLHGGWISEYDCEMQKMIRQAKQA